MANERLSFRARRAARDAAPDIFLCEIDTPAGTERYWSGIVPLTWRGNVYTGLGGVSSITGVSSEAAVFIQTVTFAVALDEATAAFAATNLRGYEARLWHGFLDAEFQVVPHPVMIARVALDTATQKTEGGTALVNLTGQTGPVTLERPSRLLWTQEQLAKEYPGVTGFDRMPGNAVKEVTWGPA